MWLLHSVARPGKPAVDNPWFPPWPQIIDHELAGKSRSFFWISWRQWEAIQDYLYISCFGHIRVVKPCKTKFESHYWRFDEGNAKPLAFQRKCRVDFFISISPLCFSGGCQWDMQNTWYTIQVSPIGWLDGKTSQKSAWIYWKSHCKSSQCVSEKNTAHWGVFEWRGPISNRKGMERSLSTPGSKLLVILVIVG